MIVRAVTMAAGLSAAAGLSQFPEFSQQYTQRLGGAVDALAEVVADFDASAAASGLSREDALAQLQGTEFLDKRQADMSRTFARSEKLTSDLEVLETAGPFTRAYFAARMTDSDVAKAAYEAYKPALPITFEGIVFAIVGFVAGSTVIGAVLALLRRVFRRRTQAT